MGRRRSTVNPPHGKRIRGNEHPNHIDHGSSDIHTGSSSISSGGVGSDDGFVAQLARAGGQTFDRSSAQTSQAEGAKRETARESSHLLQGFTRLYHTEGKYVDELADFNNHLDISDEECENGMNDLACV
ncbi:hypothetical protein ACHQM5_029113 [Ranunculus cassubicifolius]